MAGFSSGGTMQAALHSAAFASTIHRPRPVYESGSRHGRRRLVGPVGRTQQDEEMRARRRQQADRPYARPIGGYPAICYHETERSPTLPMFAHLRSGLESPKDRPSFEASRDPKMAEAESDHRQDGHRRSTISRHRSPRHRTTCEHKIHSHKKYAQKQHRYKRSRIEDIEDRRRTFTKLTSRDTIASSEPRQSAGHRGCRKKSKGGLRLFGCLGG